MGGEVNAPLTNHNFKRRFDPLMAYIVKAPSHAAICLMSSVLSGSNRSNEMYPHIPPGTFIRCEPFLP
jgi:hypothetical protein